MYARVSFANEQKERITGLTCFSRYIVIGKFTTLEDPHRINYYFSFEIMTTMMMMMMMMPIELRVTKLNFFRICFVSFWVG
jgi:hypothetical protein